MTKHHKGQVYLLIVAAIWGLGFVASDVSLTFYTPYQALFLRFLGSFLLLFLLNVRKCRTLSVSALFKGSVLGIVLFGAFLFQTVGLKYSTPSRNAFLTAVNVVIVPFLAWLVFRRKISTTRLIGTLLSLIGVGFISGVTSLSTIDRGDLLTLIGAFLYAVHILGTELMVDQEPPWMITLVQMGSSAICSFLLCLYQGQKLPASQSLGIFALLYLTVFSTLIAYLLQTIGQQHTSSSEAAMLLSTQGFFGMLGSVVLLHEHLTLSMAIGAVCIFGGIVLVEWRPKKRLLHPNKEWQEEHSSE